MHDLEVLRQRIERQAEQVFGSAAAALAWLVTPATGLNQQRPADLLQTPEGAQLVADFLGRLEFGVYS